MAKSSTVMIFVFQFLLLLAGMVGAAPTPQSPPPDDGVSSFWFGSIERQGKPAFGEADHQVFRNVKDFGAKGTFSILFYSNGS